MILIRFFTLLAFTALARTIYSQSVSSTETSEEYAQRMEWFDEAKLGIFIHWGIYAVDGVSESWSFHNNIVPYDRYMNQQKGFTASQYYPKQWTALIRESGARYAVITTKHHDGFALWNTKAGKLSAVKSASARRDLLAPFAEAARKEGLKLGFYYSLIDWSHPDYPNFTRTTTRYDIRQEPARWERFCQFNFAQLEELNKTWKPDLFWFDGDWEQTADDWQAASIVRLLRQSNPKVVINSRIQGHGDYATPEIGVPITRPSGHYWELCYTINDSWGYQQKDTNYKTPHMLLCTFVDCLNMGGNLLLDIGPKADGTIPQEQVKVLKAFGRWTAKHQEAIYGTRAGIPHGYFNGYTTLNRAGNVLYLYMPYKPTGKVSIKGIVNKVKRVEVVGSGTRLPYKIYNKVSWTEVPGIIYIDIPQEELDPDITVLALHLEGPVQLYTGAGQVVTHND